MIQTKEHGLTKHEYAKIIVIHSFLRYWGFFLSCMLAIFYFSYNKKSIVFTSFIIIIMFPLIVGSLLYIQGLLENNKFIFKPKVLYIDNDKLAIRYNAGSVVETDFVNELPLDGITKVIELKNYLFLYISRAQFLIIPKSAFFTFQDMEQFKMIIKKRK